MRSGPIATAIKFGSPIRIVGRPESIYAPEDRGTRIGWVAPTILCGKGGKVIKLTMVEEEGGKGSREGGKGKEPSPLPTSCHRWLQPDYGTAGIGWITHGLVGKGFRL